MRWSLIALVAACVLAWAPVASAQDGAAKTAREIEHEVWSPYCPGRLLADCSTSQARDLRAQIERRLERGDSKEQVVTWIRAEYGDAAVAKPSTSGRGLVLWLIPVAIFVGGALFVSRTVRRWQRPADEPAPLP